MEQITEEEKKTVDELRRRTINDVTPKMLEDVSVFYRFAKARDFDLEQAEAMLRKHLEWRKEMEIDTILTDYEPPEVYVKYGPTTFICFDEDKSIVRHVDCGRADAKGLWNVASKTELARYVFYVIEKEKDMLIKKGRNLGTPMYTPIYDFADLNYANAVNVKSLQYTSYLLTTFVDNYPESIKRLYVINAPVYFGWIFSIAKQILPKNVIDKVRVFGADGWKEALLEITDAADVPTYLGGLKKDHDGGPLCENLIHIGRPIPRIYFTSKERKKLTSKSDTQRLLLKPYSKEEIAFHVKKENSYLKWKIETTHKDIDFSLFFRGESSKDSETVEVIPKERINASSEPRKGVIKCEKAGSYTMVFDNTYSWLHSKEIFFKAEITTPKNDRQIKSMA